MDKRFALRSWMFGAAGLGLGLCIGVGMLIGSIATMNSAQRQPVLPETMLQAAASHGSDQFAIATGPIASDIEGVFFLDYVTGDLTCLVIYPRTGKIGAKFTTNVVQALGIEQGKTPKYVIATGGAEFRAQNRGQVRPASCVVYVADANTGAFAAYGIPWNSAQANNMVKQGGQFTVLEYGKVRELEIGG